MYTWDQIRDRIVWEGLEYAINDYFNLNKIPDETLREKISEYRDLLEWIDVYISEKIRENCEGITDE